MTISSSKKRIHRAALELFAERGSSAITVSELAEAANVARGTIYNNDLNPDSLFEGIASQLTNEMNARVIKTLGTEDDSAKRLAIGIRMYIRRAHEEPNWGRFLCKFGFSSQQLTGLWIGEESPLSDIQNGALSKRYNINESQMFAVINMIAGSVLSSIFSVLEGFKTWRDIGCEISELILISLGIDNSEAYLLARTDLPVLQEL